MKCSRCKRWIEANEIKFATEGDWMGKPLCRRCKFEVEEESRDRYRRRRAGGNGYPESIQLVNSVYKRY
jgi:DNA-directed RNA polymerase subunit RPC12/RpoP